MNHIVKIGTALAVTGLLTSSAASAAPTRRFRELSVSAPTEVPNAHAGHEPDAQRKSLAAALASLKDAAQSAASNLPGRNSAASPFITRMRVNGHTVALGTLAGAPQITDNDTIEVDGTNLTDPNLLGVPTGAVSLAFGSCGPLALGSTSFYYTADGTRIIFSMPSKIVDELAKPVKLNIVTAKGKSNAIPLAYLARMQLLTYRAFIAPSSATDRFEAGAMGSQPSASLERYIDLAGTAVTGSAIDSGLLNPGINVILSPSPRLGIANAAGQGVDTFGNGTRLLHGYRYLAEITKVASTADVRHASITNCAQNAPVCARLAAAPPENSRSPTIERHVAWAFAQGSGLEYALQFRFLGPQGMRPADTLPRTGNCRD